MGSPQHSPLVGQGSDLFGGGHRLGTWVTISLCTHIFITNINRCISTYKLNTFFFFLNKRTYNLQGKNPCKIKSKAVPSAYSKINGYCTMMSALSSPPSWAPFRQQNSLII